MPNRRLEFLDENTCGCGATRSIVIITSDKRRPDAGLEREAIMKAKQILYLAMIGRAAHHYPRYLTVVIALATTKLQ